MSTSSDKQNLLGLPQRSLEQFFASLDEKPYRARQVMQWIYQRGVDDFQAMTDLSMKLRHRLDEVAELRAPQEEARHDSTDGTVKWLFSSGSGQAVETAVQRR